MQKEILVNPKSPKAIGPYSTAVKIDRFVFLSGQLPIDVKTGEIVPGGIEKQARKSLDNLMAALKPYQLEANHVVKVTIFLKNLDHFASVNQIYGEYFNSDFPARSCVQVVKLPKDADIEIEAIAYQ
ncbi:MAG: Rid family detoxifying hydrolase [Atribacterota bacterium]|nr:Rid family detoxifying hydrolase [Atribacterota bacterium]MDD4895534.1 Rid family detoxifying hydrolase [Atribacterota bacterium]MDD5637169.1 Rid family detoxifying hydrolase [Atribacterota bacterium]